jgi:hypothetical protein
MPRDYKCADCGKECPQPIYLRLHLTRCGWVRATQDPRWQSSIPVGHFCVACLSARVRTITGSIIALQEVL